ncbi:MarR family transcriptional regulator [Tropicibacter sp. R16_0]|uniref:MarR family winged helix-turn-helix transcriptional regulator n=1 Tax=Tropicibacter sp. R16_0 TaxID=2821102 RepID=UPI001ADBCE64|nr:MarR family transcriptional regulator [Tropicibacter sp. R16_0]MBO9452838.1 MarR family transcriptional regulator [Tropicibacter sp. R16_0]
MSKPEQDIPTIFTLFNEIGIISQLSSRLFETRLPDGFLVSHFAVLNHLTRLGDGRTPLSIAQALQVPKTSMTHTLKGLHKAGLIAFEPNPKDSRSKCVMLTDQGRAFRENAIAALGPDMAQMAQRINVSQIADALPMLIEVREYLDKAREAE